MTPAAVGIFVWKNGIPWNGELNGTVPDRIDKKLSHPVKCMGFSVALIAGEKGDNTKEIGIISQSTFSTRKWLISQTIITAQNENDHYKPPGSSRRLNIC